MWFGRRSKTTSSEPFDQPLVPNGVTPLEAAGQVLERFLRVRDAELEPGGIVESAEIAYIQEGQSPSDAVEPGLLVRWRQRSDEFGLLVPITRLISQAGSLEGVPFYLGLAIDEPHEPAVEGFCHWFLDLPSGPY